jgi:hypothetical protein
VTLRASRLPVEEFAASLHVTRELRRIVPALKLAQIGDDILEAASERREGRHSSCWHSAGNDPRKLVVGTLLRFFTRGNIRGAFTAAPIQAVTPGAPRFEHLLTVDVRRIRALNAFRGRRRFLRLRRDSLRTYQGT